MPSLFLHRISVVRVYLYIAATTPDPAGRDPRQMLSGGVAEQQRNLSENLSQTCEEVWS